MIESYAIRFYETIDGDAIFVHRHLAAGTGSNRLKTAARFASVEDGYDIDRDSRVSFRRSFGSLSDDDCGVFDPAIKPLET